MDVGTSDSPATDGKPSFQDKEENALQKLRIGYPKEYINNITCYNSYWEL